MRLKYFGVNAGEPPKAPELPAPIPDASLDALVESGELTAQQSFWVKKHDNGFMGRGYALMVVKAANELYDVVKGVEDASTLDTIVGDVIELSNRSVSSQILPKKKDDEYDPLARQVMAKLDDQGHSGYSYFLAVREFVMTVGDRKNVQFTPKPGLLNGAVLTIQLD